jgi:ABC-2 type transport system ATP-binding protein
VAGVDAPAHPRRARARLGVCPQETSLYPRLTVAEHLRLFGALAGLRRAALRRAVTGIAEQLWLTEVLDRPAGLLSGGQRKRTQAAAALVAERPVLLLDEPTAGADPQTRRALLTVVADRAAAGAAVVCTTHYLPELAELGATLAVARAGRIISRGGQRSLLAGLAGEVRVGFAGPVPAGLRRRPASPGYWAVSALRSALQGQAGATLRAAGVLLAVAAVTAALGTWRITRGWSRSQPL